MRWPARRRRSSRPTSNRSSRRLLLEGLEDRRLLATLDVPAGFATIQAAVDGARAGDEIVVADGRYAESVDISRMGSALGRGPGPLVIRASGQSAVIESPGGPAIFNSSPFAANLFIDRIGLESSNDTPGRDLAIDLDSYQGKLNVNSTIIQGTIEGGIELTNSSGTFTFNEVEVLDSGSAAGHHGLHASEIDGKLIILGSTFRDVGDGGIMIENSGDRELALIVSDSTVAGDPVGFTTTNTGIRVELTDTAGLDITVDNNSLDDMDDNALLVIARDDTRLQGRLNDNVVFNTNQGVGIQVQLHNNAQAGLDISVNTLSDSRSQAMQLLVNDNSFINAHMDNNLFFNIGDGAGDDALTISTNAGATSSLNLVLTLNDFVTVTGNGLLIDINGGSTVNLTAIDTSFSDINSSSGTNAFDISAADTAQLNVDLRANSVSDTNAGDYRLAQQGSSLVRLATDQTTAGNHFTINNQNPGDPATISGTITLVPLGSFEGTVPLLLGDFVWHDQDGDGVQGGTEPGLIGVVIHLTGTETASGVTVDRTTVADEEGTYQFSAMLPGTYTLTIEVPVGFILASTEQPGDPALDSDFDRSTKSTDVITLTELTSNSTTDAGLVHNWQNPDDPLDVNNDKIIAPVDALFVINDLNANGSRPLPLPPLPPNEPPPFLNTNGDTLASPVDVLLVINFLNGASGTGEGEGEGNAGDDSGEGESAADIALALAPAPRSATVTRRATRTLASHSAPAGPLSVSDLARRTLDADRPQPIDDALFGWDQWQQAADEGQHDEGQHDEVGDLLEF